ncbi:hypothetical protein NVP1193O_033 [Vibrio phage 1.193.O._10N.286.52.C6]|nr:hypothetical protein NVP1193O_033 [Vibrio phage 1.193.O._10N.286.52.C6]
MEYGGLNNKQILQVLELSKYSIVSAKYVQVDIDDFVKVFGTKVWSLRLLEHLLSVGLEYVDEKATFILLKRI